MRSIEKQHSHRARIYGFTLSINLTDLLPELKVSWATVTDNSELRLHQESETLLWNKQEIMTEIRKFILVLFPPGNSIFVSFQQQQLLINREYSHAHTYKWRQAALFGVWKDQFVRVLPINFDYSDFTRTAGIWSLILTRAWGKLGFKSYSEESDKRTLSVTQKWH